MMRRDLDRLINRFTQPSPDVLVRPLVPDNGASPQTEQEASNKMTIEEFQRAVSGAGFSHVMITTGETDLSGREYYVRLDGVNDPSTAAIINEHEVGEQARAFGEQQRLSAKYIKLCGAVHSFLEELENIGEIDRDD